MNSELWPYTSQALLAACIPNSVENTVEPPETRIWTQLLPELPATDEVHCTFGPGAADVGSTFLA